MSVYARACALLISLSVEENPKYHSQFMNISLLKSILMEFPEALVYSFFCKVAYLWLVNLDEAHHSHFSFSFFFCFSLSLCAFSKQSKNRKIQFVTKFSSKNIFFSLFLFRKCV